MTEPVVHCQVCGRPIKAKVGIIAHHGYQRPHRGSGWQTASCYGARHVPYEVGHDALDLAVISCTAHLDRLSIARGKMLSDPPATLDYVRTNAYGREQFRKTFAKPDGFDTAKWSGHGSASPQTYEGVWLDKWWTLKSNIKGTGETLAYLTKRRADWVPPAETGAAA